MRAKGLVTEIRTEDLRFSPRETAAYLQHAQFFQLSQPALDLMEARFEGWIAGLQLAALSLRSAVSQDDVLIGLSGDNPNITGYLMDEVLFHQYPAIQSFLLKTSILDRLSPSLCAAVMGESDTLWNARACLDWIERSELFITPLDNRREWYRYHQLFQELLQQRLSVEATPDQVAQLHLQASAWYEEHGLIEEALQHSLEAGDLELTVHQITAGLCEVTNREDRPTLERWLRLLPDGVIENHAGLLMVKAWALQFSWQLGFQAQVLQQAGALLEASTGRDYDRDEKEVLRGQILALKAQHAFFSNQNDRAIDYARQALTLLPPSWKFVRGGAMLFLGMAMQAIGRSQEAEKFLLDEFASQVDKTDVYSLAVLRGLCFVYLNCGSLVRCEQTAQLLLQGSVSRKIAIMKNWSDWYLGLVHYQWNELEAAAGYFSQIMENRYAAQVTTMRDAVAGIALIHQLRGDPTQAWQIVESISRYDLELTGIEDERTRSLRARLMLMEGDLESAGRWVDSYTAQPPNMPLLWLAEPQIMRVRALLARGNQADLQSARQVLDVLEDIIDRTYNIRFKIQVLAFRAVLLDAQGETVAAEALLKQALELGRPGRFTRVFLDLGKPMQAILNRLARQYPDMQTIPAILAAFAEVARIPEKNGAQTQLSHLSRHGNASLVDPLTPREIEILGMLRGPKNIKQIAQQLFISYATAKRHTINIYAKLGVNQRWDAVNRAEELGILPPR
jgi:LuxR family maltose regulon positive regulatory protein